LCPSSVCVVATFPGIVLFPLLYSLLLFFSLIHFIVLKYLFYRFFYMFGSLYIIAMFIFFTSLFLALCI
jgi:hypothetical protein